jgi:hypothetical protein
MSVTNDELLRAVIEVKAQGAATAATLEAVHTQVLKTNGTVTGHGREFEKVWKALAAVRTALAVLQTGRDDDRANASAVGTRRWQRVNFWGGGAWAVAGALLGGASEHLLRLF